MQDGRKVAWDPVQVRASAIHAADLRSGFYQLCLIVRASYNRTEEVSGGAVQHGGQKRCQQIIPRPSGIKCVVFLASQGS